MKRMEQPYRLAGRHLRPNSSDCRKYDVTGVLSVILTRLDERCSVDFMRDGRRPRVVTVVGQYTREVAHGSQTEFSMRGIRVWPGRREIRTVFRLFQCHVGLTRR